MAYIYIRILFSLKKDENSVACHNMDEPWGHYAKLNKSHKKINTVWFHHSALCFYEFDYLRYDI